MRNNPINNADIPAGAEPLLRMLKLADGKKGGVIDLPVVKQVRELAAALNRSMQSFTDQFVDSVAAVGDVQPAVPAKPLGWGEKPFEANRSEWL